MNQETFCLGSDTTQILSKLEIGHMPILPQINCVQFSLDTTVVGNFPGNVTFSSYLATISNKVWKTGIVGS